MQTATATLKNYRQSPRKVRLVAEAVQGKSAHEAVETLRFVTKRAAKPIRKLINSAIANARSKGMEENDLVVRTITVNEGVTLKRARIRAMGSMNLIRKRTSHVYVELAEAGGSSQSSGKAQKKQTASAQS